VLTVSEKNCLPSIEKSPYRKEKKLLTVEGKNCLPYQKKKCLTFAVKVSEEGQGGQGGQGLSESRYVKGMCVIMYIPFCIFFLERDVITGYKNFEPMKREGWT